MGNGVEEAQPDRDDEQNLDDQDGPEENEDNVSEISGLSDVSISGAGRWHPMKGLSVLSISCILSTRFSLTVRRYLRRAILQRSVGGVLISLS